MNYGCIPAVIYTEPEVAWVGPTEKELQEKEIKYKKGIFLLQLMLEVKRLVIQKEI